MDFITSVRHTRKQGLNKSERLIEGCLGLVGETGEVVDLLKKHLYHGHELDKKKFMEEIGDSLFYIQYLLDAVGEDDRTYSIFDAMSDNIIKRLKRYPNGFSTKDSVERRDTHK